MSANMNNNMAAAWKQFGNWHQEKRGSDDIASDQKDDGIIMKPCPNCFKLMQWQKFDASLEQRICKNCKYNPDEGKELETDDHMGFNKDGNPIIQHGLPEKEGGGAKYSQLAIGYGKDAHRLKLTTKFTQSFEHSEKLKYMYEQLVNATLLDLCKGMDYKPDSIKASVIRDFDEFYARFPSRQWTKDMLNQLALSLYRSFSRNKIYNINKEKIARKIHEIYARDFKKDAPTNASTSINGVSRLGKADKLHQQLLAADQRLKKNSDYAAVMSQSVGAHKKYIAEEISDVGLNAKTIGYLSLTFDDLLANIGEGINRATSKTTNPILLAMVLRRHGILINKSNVEKLKATAKRHYRPIMENSARLQVRVSNGTDNVNLNKNANGNQQCAYIKLKTLFSRAMAKAQLTASKDQIYNMLVDFDETARKYGRLAQRATVLACLEVKKHKDILDRHDKKATNFDRNLPGGGEKAPATKLWSDVSQLAIKLKSACSVASWSRLADPEIIDSAVVSFMQAAPRENYIPFFKQALNMSGYIVDLLAFASTLQKHGIDAGTITEIMRKLVPISDQHNRDALITIISNNTL